MKNDWINATCEDCRFNMEDLCRKNPPNIKDDGRNGEMSLYPRVGEKKLDTYYHKLACSQFEYKGEGW